ncbi:hypothetical protein [Nostoc sp. MS1]|uniref:hypothetical protein n=1 Tax=Nostoc sp. MS1 TaxID=2764711 RepID=UPI001CC6F158|nr:hypothetical protein [Nostoc sp. MS1]
MRVASVYLGLVAGILTGGIFLPAIAQVKSDGTTNTNVDSKPPANIQPQLICTTSSD